MEEMRKILEAIDREVSGIMDDWSDPRSECREILRLTAQALALSSPHHEAREEDWIRDAFSQIATGGIKGEPNNYRDTVAVMRDIAKGALSRLVAQKDEGQMRKPANPKNPCADCKNGIGPRPDAICDECEGDESELPSMWEPAAPEPRPAEEAMPEAIAAADMINDAIDRARISGDGAGLYTRILSIVDEALRSQLTRKDEGLKKVFRRLLDDFWPMGSDQDKERIVADRIGALREPDGRKGE